MVSGGALLLQNLIDLEDRREVELHSDDIATMVTALGGRGVFTVSSDGFAKRFDFGLELVEAEAVVQSMLSS